jgi:hypothetical protein
LNDPRVDPAADDNYTIRWAAGRGHVEVVQVLLNDPRVDPAADDNDAIRMAADAGHVAVARALLEAFQVGHLPPPPSLPASVHVIWKDIVDSRVTAAYFRTTAASAATAVTPPGLERLVMEYVL